MRSWHLINRIQRSNDMKYNPCHGINRNQRVYLAVVKRFKVARARYFPSRRRWSTSENLEDLKDGEDPIRGNNNNLRWRKRVGKLQWKRSRGSRERRKRKIARHSVCERETHGYRGISRDPSWRNFARMSFRAPRSMMARRGVAIKTRSLPMKKKKGERKKETKKERRRNWSKEWRGETTRNLHFRQSRDELGESGVII